MAGDDWVLILVLALATTLVVSVFGKVLYWESTLDWLDQVFRRGVGVHRVAAGILVAEASIVVGLALAPSWGAIALVAWISGATALLAILRRRVQDCACFGPRKAVSWRTYARNACIAGAAVALATLSPGATTMRIDVLAAAVGLGSLVVVLTRGGPWTMQEV